jgi:hypothetical protein
MLNRMSKERSKILKAERKADRKANKYEEKPEEKPEKKSEKILKSGLTEREENELRHDEKEREKRMKKLLTTQKKLGDQKRREATQEARERMDILVKKINEGDFDYKIYKRFDRTKKQQEEYEETGEYPEDSDAFDDIMEWFDENIRGFVETEETIDQYVERLEKEFREREYIVVDSIDFERKKNPNWKKERDQEEYQIAFDRDQLKKKREKVYQLFMQHELKDTEEKDTEEKGKDEEEEHKLGVRELNRYARKIQYTDIDKVLDKEDIIDVFNSRIKPLLNPDYVDASLKKLLFRFEKRIELQKLLEEYGEENEKDEKEYDEIEDGMSDEAYEIKDRMFERFLNIIEYAFIEDRNTKKQYEETFNKKFLYGIDPSGVDDAYERLSDAIEQRFKRQKQFEDDEEQRDKDTKRKHELTLRHFERFLREIKRTPPEEDINEKAYIAMYEERFEPYLEDDDRFMGALRNHKEKQKIYEEEKLRENEEKKLQEELQEKLLEKQYAKGLKILEKLVKRIPSFDLEKKYSEDYITGLFNKLIRPLIDPKIAEASLKRALDLLPQREANQAQEARQRERAKRQQRGINITDEEYFTLGEEGKL